MTFSGDDLSLFMIDAIFRIINSGWKGRCKNKQ